MSNTSWVKQPEKCTEKSLLRSRLSFLFSVPRASTKSMQKIYLGSRIPPVASLIPLPWRDFEHLFATVLHCNLFKRNTRDFFGFFSSQILFLLIWNGYIADNQLQKLFPLRKTKRWAYQRQKKGIVSFFRYNRPWMQLPRSKLFSICLANDQRKGFC